MEKTKLWPCPLDEKNLITDWIKEIFEDDGFLYTPNNGHNGVNQFIAFFEKRLVSVTWAFGSNQLSFCVLPDHFGIFYANEQVSKAIEEFKKRVGAVEQCDNGSDSRVHVKYNEVNNRVDFFFYWDNCG